MNGITLRLATLDDAAILASLQAEMDDATLQAGDVERMRETLVYMAAYPDFNAYLLIADRVVVGTFSLLTFCSPSHHGSKQAVLDAVVVTGSQRGQGWGERMIRYAADRAGESGCYKISLSSNIKRSSAHRFYERLGFRQHGISFSLSLEVNELTR